MRGRLILLAALCASCFTDAGTQTGTATSTDTTGTPTTGTDTGTDAGTEPTGAAGTTGESSSSAATTDAGTTTATTATTSSDTGTTTTGTGESCNGAAINVLLLAGDAVAVAPMMKLMSMMGEGTIAASDVAEEGTITFTAQLPCGDSYAVWGRVVDTIPGVNEKDPDSFYMRADDGSERGWFYGCETTELPAGYSWRRLRAGSGEGMGCVIAEDWTLDLSAGTHTITLRNREATGMNGSAAVARLLVTNSLDYVPGPED